MTGISVDQDFARFGGKSYAINKITSLEIRSYEPFKADGAYLLGAVAAVLVLLGIGQLLSDFGVGFIILVFAAGAAAIAWRQWEQSHIVEYRLFIMTSSSEVQAYSSRDPDDVVGLRDRIEAAMAGRL